jgi:hypothetical protein
MQYPTLEQVESADRFTLCRWWRFLPSPGSDAIGRSDIETRMERETAVMSRIAERFKAAGGMTPEISKALGWDR